MTSKTWRLGEVTLKVLDLDAQVAFYRKFGFELMDRSEASASLGAGGTSLLRLRLLTPGRPRPSHTAGLYHFAILVPSEADLGSYVHHAAAERLPFIGAADHLVSEALYFEDPEGNQIEVYRDRPGEAWAWADGAVEMATLHLDLNRLAGVAGGAFEGFPEGTVLGHMHLSVGDLDRSQAFYEGLGMSVTADIGGFMRFMSWDGYHHHLGINLAQGRGASRVEDDVSGLDSFSISPAGHDPAPMVDPDGIQVVPRGRQVSVAAESSR